MLERVVADGSLADQEIRDLGGWLDRAASTSTIPGIHFLREEVGGILADGSVTDGERTLLRNAILRVLPITERERAKARITDARTRERAEAKARESAAANVPTDRQLDFIRDLGGVCPDAATRQEASEIIERLLASCPTVRQRMVLRFWNRLDLMSAGVEGVSAWMDQWYAEDPNRLDAWTLWKRESRDEGSRSPEAIERVPLGVGQQYLARVAARAVAARPVAVDPTVAPGELRSGPSGFLILMACVGVIAIVIAILWSYK